MNIIKRHIRLFVFVLVLSTTYTLWSAANDFKYSGLDNGMAVWMEERTNIPLVNFVIAVDVGSKDETDSTSGMIHILEHLIFLGETEFRDEGQLALQMRRHGAHFNAHTSHDMMTFEISLPSRYWEFGLSLLKEKIFHLKFSPDKLEKEKSIIFEEIAQHRDDPYKTATFLAIQSLFNAHPYERPIPGNPDVIKGTSIDDIKSFYRQYFVPSKCALAVVGDFNIPVMEKKIIEIFSPISISPPASTSALSFPSSPSLKKNVSINHRMDIKLAHLMVAYHAPPSDHADQLSFSILDQIFGSGLSPMIRRNLWKMGHPLTRSVSTRYIPLRYGGAYLIYITLEPKNLRTCKRELEKFLSNSWRYRYSVSDYPPQQRHDSMIDYLETAKSNIKFSYQEFQELGLNAATSYARYLLFHKDPTTLKKQEPYMVRVEKTKSSHLKDIASRYLAGKKHVTITILPDKKKK
jgi:zinc protease